MTCGTKKKSRLEELMRQYLKISPDVTLNDDTRIGSLGVATWRVIDLGIVVADEFNIELTADRALALDTVGDWRALVG